jgi:hypothetical protein
VRLDVGDLPAGATRDLGDEEDLAHHLVGQVVCWHVDVDTTEVVAVGIADLRADRDAVRDGSLARGSHELLVTGVSTTADVGARDDLEQRGVLTGAPSRPGLAEVRVEIDLHKESLVRPAPHQICS